MYGTSQTNLTNMTASRDYWQHTVAHDDPNVWDNRYNAGYSQCALHQRLHGGRGVQDHERRRRWPGRDGRSAAVPVNVGRPGLGSVPPGRGWRTVSAISGSNGDDSALHIFRNGVLALQGNSGNGGLNTMFAVQGNLNVNAGDTISVRASGSGDSGLQGGYLLVTVGSQ